MVHLRRPETGATAEETQSISRRQLLTRGATIVVAAPIIVGRASAKSPADPLSDENLIDASALSGEELTLERVRAVKPRLESTLKQLKALRQFDPDEGEPLPMVRL